MHDDRYFALVSAAREVLIVLALAGMTIAIAIVDPAHAGLVAGGTVGVLGVLFGGRVATKASRVMAGELARASARPPRHEGGGDPPVPPQAPTGWTGVPPPGAPSVPPVVRRTLLGFGLVLAAGCAPRPPTAHEAAYARELAGCYAEADQADSGAVYAACRARVNARYGRDAGAWR